MKTWEIFCFELASKEFISFLFLKESKVIQLLVHKKQL